MAGKHSLPPPSEALWADPGEVASWAEDMPWEYLECRKRGRHLMDYHRAYYDKEARAYREILRCICCKVVTQENLIDPGNGEYIEHGGLKYEKESGYLREKGSGRIGADSKGVIRLMVIAHRAETKAPRRRLRRVV